MMTGAISETGFQVAADNAVDFFIGTQAAEAGMISSNIRRLGSNLHADLGQVQQTIIAQARQVSEVNQNGFEQIYSAVEFQTDKLSAIAQDGVNHLDEEVAGVWAISAASVAVTAAGFASTVLAINRLRGDVRSMHGELAQQGHALLEIQKLASRQLESLIDYASRTLATQEKILETLVHSRTAEAQQLIRQGWDNLKGGFIEDAFVRFEKSLEYDNTVYFTHAELARIYEQKGLLEMAEEHHRRAIAFAAGISGETQGYARIQYAAFLERQKRLAECIKQARAAADNINVDTRTNSASATSGTDSKQEPKTGKNVSGSVEWRFYLAEMLVKSGEVVAGLAELKICIQRDARFFETSMSSICFKAAQPALSRLLIKIDAEQRVRSLQLLDQCGAALSALVILDASNSNVLRARAASIFEEILSSKFANLKKHEQAAKELLAEIDNSISVAVSQTSAAVKDALNSVRQLQNKKPEFMNGKQLFLAVLCADFWGLLLALPFYIAHIIEANFTGPIDAGVMLLFFPFSFVVFIVLMAFRTKAFRHELVAWERGELNAATNTFTILKNKHLVELKSAASRHKIEIISAAIAELELLQSDNL